MATVTRLNSSGTYFINGEFNEVLYSTVSNQVITSTNLLAYSDLQVVSGTIGLWNGINISYSGRSTAPDNSNNAVKLVETAISGEHYLEQQITISTATTATYTYSVFMKAAERTTAEIRIVQNGGSYDSNVIYNLITGVTTGNAGIITSNFQRPLGATGWWHCGFTYVMPTSTTMLHRIHVVSAANAGSYLGDGVSGYYAWGAQLVPGSTATTYMPTGARLAGASTGNRLIGNVPFKNRIDNAGNVYNATGEFDEVTGPITTNGLYLYVDSKKAESYVNGQSGFTWKDLSPTSGNINLNSASAPPTWWGTDSTFQFNSATSYITLPNSYAPTGNSCTVCFWNFGIGAGGSGTSILWGNDGSNNRTINMHVPWIDGSIIFDGGNSGATADRVSTAGGQNYQGWHHWAFTKDAVAGTMAIYRDGVVLASGTGKTLPFNAPTVFQIGRYFSFTPYHDGRISQIQFYNRGLSGGEVANNYNASASQFGLAPIAKPAAKSLGNTGTMYIRGQYDEVTKIVEVGGTSTVLLYYDFSQTLSYSGSGTTAYDLSDPSRARSINLTGTTFDPVDGGGALVVPAALNVTTNGSITLSVLNTMSVSLWIKTTTLSGAVQRFVTFTSSGTEGFVVRINGGNPGQIQFYTTQGSILTPISASGQLVQGTIYNITAVTDGSLLLIYNNGVLVATGAQSGNFASGTMTYALSAPGESFIGKIYQMTAWNKALSATEVLANYTLTRNKYIPLP